MEIKKYTINDNEYTFVNDSFSTSNSWGHITHLFRNGQEIGNYRIRYYNRTWEAYEYQTCMKECLDTTIKQYIQNFIDGYKKKNNIKKFKSGQKTEVIELAKKEIETAELSQLYNLL